jgi:hypothetical protein
MTVPIAMMQPIKGVLGGLAKTLVGLHNSLDKTQEKRMSNKYLLVDIGTSQSKQ